MADVSKLLPIILQWEGLFVDDKLDLGGATNMGVTIGTWKQCGYDKDNDGDIDVADLKLLTKSDVQIVLKKYYWDRWKADEIRNQSIANILVDWVWGSGVYGIKIPQRILRVPEDGKVGTLTLGALNNWHHVNNSTQKVLFETIKEERNHFIDAIIAKRPEQKRFEKGWRNRINYFQYSDI